MHKPVIETLNGVLQPSWPSEITVHLPVTGCLHMSHVLSALEEKLYELGVAERDIGVDLPEDGFDLVMLDTEVHLTHITTPGVYRLRENDSCSVYRYGNELAVNVIGGA